MSKIVEERLKRWKNKLIDLSKRNRLLNFKPTKLTTVRIVDEIPSAIYETIVLNEKSMSFLPVNPEDEDDDDPYEDADAFVKPISLQSEEDRDLVIEEAKKGNIILLNISDLSKRNAIKLKELINGVREGIDAIDGDIARITQDRVLVTPSKVKIIKRKEN